MSAISWSVIVAFSGFTRLLPKNHVPEALNNHDQACSLMPKPDFSNIHDVVLKPCHAL